MKWVFRNIDFSGALLLFFLAIIYHRASFFLLAILAIAVGALIRFNKFWCFLTLLGEAFTFLACHYGKGWEGRYGKTVKWTIRTATWLFVASFFIWLSRVSPAALPLGVIGMAMIIIPLVVALMWLVTYLVFPEYLPKFLKKE